MALLKDTLIQGSARVTDTLYTNLLSSNNLNTKLLQITSDTANSINEGINFINSSSTITAHIGTSTNFGIYSAGTIILRPGAAQNNSTKGMVLSTTSLLPENAVITLGGTSNRWNGVYSSTGNFSGTVTADRLSTNIFLDFRRSDGPSYIMLPDSKDLIINNGSTNGAAYANLVIGKTGITNAYGGSLGSSAYPWGSLYSQGPSYIYSGNSQWCLDTYIYNKSKNQVAEIYYNSGNADNVTTGQFSFRQYSPKATPDTAPSGFHETFQLPSVTAARTDNGTYSIITTKNLSNITSVGTISSGTWNGSKIGVAYGGTGATTFTSDCVVVGNGTNAMESRGLKVTGATDANVVVQAYTSGKGLTIQSPGGAAAISITTAANSGTGALALTSGGNMSITSSSEKTLTLSGGSTVSIIKPSIASIVFYTNGNTNNDSEVGRFNLSGMFQLNSNVTQSTHKLLVNGDSAFTGKIAFIDTPAATLTEKVYIQQANNALQLVAKAINFPTITGGTGIVASDLGASANPRYRPASWKYNAGITPVDGDIVTVKIPSGADDYGTWLSLDNGSTYHPIIHSNGSRLQNWFSSNMSITLRYDSLATCSVFGAVRSGSIVATNSRSTITGCWRLITQYDTGNDGRWYVRYYTTKAYKAVTASHVIGGTSNGYTNVDDSTDAAFDIRYPVLFTGSNMSANTTNNNVFTFHYAVNIKNSSGNNITFPAHVPLYIKGTISGYTFTPISGGNPFVSEITEADDGYVYYYIGKSYATTAMSFDTTARKILWYKNGIICDYTGLNNVSNNSSLNNISGSIGDIIYWSAANTPAHLAKGTAGKFLKMGNNNVPIWGDGSEVTLNGTATTTPSFYAPTTVGTNGQILMSSGTGAPAWTDTTSITSVGTITSGTWQGGVIASAYLGAHTHNYLPLTGGDVTGLVNIKMAADAGIHVVDTGNNNLTVGLTVGSGHQNHGIWSTGYAPTDSTFTSDGKWVIYRNSAGDARTQLRLFGAVWNDYAEYRKQAYKINPGRVVIDLDNGLVIQTEQRLMSGAQVVSDTFGFAIGENDECKTPLAVSGRVLVYPYRNRYEYHAGMAVCSAPNGTVDIMTREEIKEYPDAIVGIVSEIPQYEEWGEKPVKVDGRIWIKVK